MNLVNYELALKTLKSGLPIIFPTDTLPAIGCLPKFSKIIYEFKKRDRNKPLILMGSEYKQLIDYVHESAKEDYENIASKYWPGALTMVIPASEKQTTILTSNDLTLGLRIPNSYMAQSLMRETGPLLPSSEEGTDIASLQSNRSPNVSVVNLTQGMDGGTQVQQSRGTARSSVTALSNTTNLAPVSLMIRNTFLT